MRATADENDVRIKAYAGSTGVLLALNVASNKRDGLLGFAIRRIAHATNDKSWLTGSLHFAGFHHNPSYPINSNVAPIQKFRWSDYRIYPDQEYSYEVHPVYGQPGQLVLEDGPTVTVKTASLESGEQRVLFNRAAAASQAFSRKFGYYEAQLKAAQRARQPVPPMPPAALEWLSRGVLEQILGFIARAQDATWGLDIAIYEYELPAIVQAVEAAHARGAKVRVVYHGKKNDEQAVINRNNLAGLPTEIQHGRLTSKLCHHKYMVLSRIVNGQYQPQMVLCGSTNFTENGVYRQANLVHVLEMPDIAAQYLGLFEVLFNGADTRATRRYINQHNPFDAQSPLFASFSPRSGLTDLSAVVTAVQNARRDVLFCTVFKLYEPLLEALYGAPNDGVLRYGLQNTRSRITGVHTDRTASFSAAAYLTTGLEGFLRETTAGQRGNILVHTKVVIIDFTSDHPTVISGSHNLSEPASSGNDENMLVLRGNTDVADIFGCELMRLYEHYRFRFNLAESRRSGGAAGNKPLVLDSTSAWTDRYYGGDLLKTLDRVRFAGLF